MFESFSQARYEEELSALFLRFPSVQNVPFQDAYKPGLERMLEFSRVLGNPEEKLRCVHVAGTNGKGSVSNMLASALSAHGHRTGLFTSPHIEDFRERMRLADREGQAVMVPREYVFDFILRYKAEFERLQLSFFEITTGMAFRWFADSGCEFAVIEVGLGGRLDSTNIITPELSVITSIGLDHCDLLGNTLDAIAGEKAGIIKPGVPVVIGEDHPLTRPVFEAVATSSGSEIIFAQDHAPSLWDHADEITSAMDLQGGYQRKNLRTVLTALDIMSMGDAVSVDAIIHTAARMDFHGRWEKLIDSPLVLCDIGHNAHALRNNFAQLEEMMASGKYTSLQIVYAVMADKDFDSIMPLMPAGASYHFAAPATRRSLPAEDILRKYSEYRKTSGMASGRLQAHSSVSDAVRSALSEDTVNPLVYIGGSTFAVSEAILLFV